ncbi:MAG: thioredoxin [Candidatus Dojkabacteria bacterium]|nr:thioredoxin [Candidatus Dojkabacteria bacterium]
MALELTNDSFDTEVLKFEGLVIVDFWAPWCGPCQMVAPIIEELSNEYKDNDKVKICKLNVDDNQEIAQRYGIMSIPTMKFFKAGEIVDEIVGLQPKEAIAEKISGLQ